MRFLCPQAALTSQKEPQDAVCASVLLRKHWERVLDAFVSLKS